MKRAEIVKILKEIDDMKEITKVKIKMEGVEISVEKTKNKVTPVVTKSSGPKSNHLDVDHSKATAFQVKYARDLMGSVFNGDERMSLDFLAHTLEVPMEEVPDMSTWDETLTADMASSIITPLKSMGGKREGGFS